MRSEGAGACVVLSQAYVYPEAGIKNRILTRHGVEENMASRRKLDVEEAAGKESEGPKIKFEEACILVTTIALICGIIMVWLKSMSSFGEGPF